MTVAHFEFVDAPDLKFDRDDFLLWVPAGIRTKTELLSALASGGNFPEGFGQNWDALTDCLRDLSWIPNRKVAIVHSDLPLASNPAECTIYLDVLHSALLDWAQSVRPDLTELPANWQYVDHVLRVLFPTGARYAISQNL